MEEGLPESLGTKGEKESVGTRAEGGGKQPSSEEAAWLWCENVDSRPHHLDLNTGPTDN